MQLLFEIKLRMNVYFRLQSNASSNIGNWLLFFYSLTNNKKIGVSAVQFKKENHIKITWGQTRALYRVRKMYTKTIAKKIRLGKRCWGDVWALRH